jgi:hypothetical protein
MLMTVTQEDCYTDVVLLYSDLPIIRHVLQQRLEHIEKALPILLKAKEEGSLTTSEFLMADLLLHDDRLITRTAKQLGDYYMSYKKLAEKLKDFVLLFDK